MYNIPSVLRHGEECTNWGILKGSFFKGSLLLPIKYNEPSLGSGKNMGISASDVSSGTWTIGSENNFKIMHNMNNSCYLLSLIFHKIFPVYLSKAANVPSSVANTKILSSYSFANSVFKWAIFCKKIT